ncbi:GNAT family N-acetyltransferase [Arthrobacter sp. TMN-49]
MTVHLIPVSAQRFPAWLERSRSEYESDLVATGESSQEAHRHARESIDASFPAGIPTTDNAVFDVVDDTGTIAGYLWIGTDSSEDSHSWWVWDIVVNKEQRGKGLGRATMKLAEDYARSQGAHTLGLSVFGFNHAARAWRSS